MANSKGEPCNYITGKLFLPTSAFTEKGIDWGKTNVCKQKKFNRPRNKKFIHLRTFLLRPILEEKDS